MSSKCSDGKYSPYNLCCAIGELEARCVVCKKDLCANCFGATHTKNGNMFCGKVRLFWKNINFLEPKDPSQLELHPVKE